MASDRLTRYNEKRDFSKTTEPRAVYVGRRDDSDERAADASFVVQKHAARSLHYDFRLEVNGTMPSWAVPKGPSYDPKVKRFAVRVEDHPLEYRDFEGTIPGGEYGGGEVIVWDTGTYRNVTSDPANPTPMSEALERGHVSIWLDGTKLHGGWSLTRTPRPGEKREGWILVKRKDEFADAELDVTEAAPRSAVTGRSVEDLKGDTAHTWTRARATWSPPMLAELRGDVPDRNGWVFERKFDGLRMIAVRNGDDVELWSRGRQSLTRRFAGIAQALAALPVDNFTLDGEVVAFEGDRTSFALLQAPGSTAEAVYEVFDVLHLLGSDVRDLAVEERVALVAELIEPSARVVPVATLDGDAEQLLAGACRDGWEGLIAKRAGSRYRSGRSADWLKLKCSTSQELVIGGFTEPNGKRRFFGAILVGYHDAHGRLCYAGKVGTGFGESTLEDLHARFAKRARTTSPFVDPPRIKSVHWVRPDLVANVVFSEWTSDGKLRHPRFDGLRPDKPAAEVERESAGTAGTS